MNAPLRCSNHGSYHQAAWEKSRGRILSMDPKAKILVSSGYSNDPVLAEHVEYGFCDVITKPFSLEELHEKIVRVLSQEKSW